jgi:hypothetical protein
MGALGPVERGIGFPGEMLAQAALRLATKGATHVHTLGHFPGTLR